MFSIGISKGFCRYVKIISLAQAVAASLSQCQRQRLPGRTRVTSFRKLMVEDTASSQ